MVREKGERGWKIPSLEKQCIEFRWEELPRNCLAKWG